MTKKLSKIILAMTLFLSLIFGQGNTVQAASQTVLTGQEAIATLFKAYSRRWQFCRC